MVTFGRRCTPLKPRSRAVPKTYGRWVCRRVCVISSFHGTSVTVCVVVVVVGDFGVMLLITRSVVPVELIRIAYFSPSLFALFPLRPQLLGAYHRDCVGIGGVHLGCPPRAEGAGWLTANLCPCLWVGGLGVECVPSVWVPRAVSFHLDLVDLNHFPAFCQPPTPLFVPKNSKTKRKKKKKTHPP